MRLQPHPFMRWLLVFTVAVSGVMWLHDGKSRKESRHGAAWERAGPHPGGGCLVDCGVGRDPGADRATLRALRTTPADAPLWRRIAQPGRAQERLAARRARGRGTALRHAAPAGRREVG